MSYIEKIAEEHAKRGIIPLLFRILTMEYRGKEERHLVTLKLQMFDVKYYG